MLIHADPGSSPQALLPESAFRAYGTRGEEPSPCGSSSVLQHLQVLAGASGRDEYPDSAFESAARENTSYRHGGGHTFGISPLLLSRYASSKSVEMTASEPPYETRILAPCSILGPQQTNARRAGMMRRIDRVRNILEVDFRVAFEKCDTLDSARKSLA
jgi:hypothetical protein